MASGTHYWQVLQDGRLDGLEMRMLLCFVTGVTRTTLAAWPERVLGAEELVRLEALVGRRVAGEPMAYLIGRREFFGREFSVDRRVLIPRPETELLVELALQRLPPQGRVLDLGTGSGVIAVSLACERPDLQVDATDVCAQALEVARGNAQQLGAKVRFLESNWLSAFSTGERFDLIVSNPPYITANDPHLQNGDLRFEPLAALTDRADGLSALRTIIAGAPLHLASEAWLLLEHGYDQAQAVRTLLSEAGLNEVQSWTDLAGIERVSGGRGPRFSD
jgi:release factor glutamine methyltransferase